MWLLDIIFMVYGLYNPTQRVIKIVIKIVIWTLLYSILNPKKNIKNILFIVRIIVLFYQHINGNIFLTKWAKGIK